MFTVDIGNLFVAAFTFVNFLMYKEMQRKDEEFRQKAGDLFQAISIATMLSGPSGTSTSTIDELIKIFKTKYTGKTRIF